MKYTSFDIRSSKGFFMLVVGFFIFLNLPATAQNSAEEIINKALSNISENYANDTKSLHFIYRETIQEDKQYTYLGEAIGTLEYAAYQQPFNHSKAQQTYHSGDHFNGNIIGNRWHNTLTQPSDKAMIQGSRQSQQFFKYPIGQEITGGPLGLTAYDKIKYPSHFFKAHKNGQVQINEGYQFELVGTQNYEGKEVYLLKFKPVKIHKQEAGFEGTCYVEKENFAIVYLTYSQTTGQAIYRAEKEEFTHQLHTVELSYAQTNQKWHLAHVKVTDQVDWKDIKLAKRYATYTTQSSLWVSNTEFTAYSSDKATMLLPNTWSSTLSQVQGAYQANLWYEIENSSFYPTLEGKIRSDLEVQQALEMQFRSLPVRLTSNSK